MQKYQEVTASWKKIFINNFLGGISWSLGATIGFSIIIAIIGIIAHYIDFIPIVGSFISNILDFVLKNNHYFK